MRQTTGTRKSPGEKIVKDIKRATRKHYSSEEKIRIVLDGLRGEDSIAELCRREGISQGIYYTWSKDFMEAGKRRLAGDTARAANTDEADAEFISVLSAYKDEWLGLSMKIGEAAMANPDEAGAAAVDYLMYSGYVTLAYFWARMAMVARQKIAEDSPDKDFYEAKLMTAQFYFQRLLPRTESLKLTMLAGADNLMQMPEELFAV